MIDSREESRIVLFIAGFHSSVILDSKYIRRSIELINIHGFLVAKPRIIDLRLAILLLLSLIRRSCYSLPFLLLLLALFLTFPKVSSLL